jgi:hypothetical protein
MKRKGESICAAVFVILFTIIGASLVSNIPTLDIIKPNQGLEAQSGQLYTYFGTYMAKGAIKNNGMECKKYVGIEVQFIDSAHGVCGKGSAATLNLHPSETWYYTSQMDVLVGGYISCVPDTYQIVFNDIRSALWC